MGDEGCVNSLYEWNSFPTYNVYQIITLSTLDIFQFYVHYFLMKLKTKGKS